MNLRQRLTHFITEFGALPSDTPETRTLKAIWAVAVFSTVILYGALISPLYFNFNEPIPGFIYGGWALWALLNMLLYGYWHRNLTLVFYAIEIPLPLVQMGVSLALGTFINSGADILFGFINPALATLV